VFLSMLDDDEEVCTDRVMIEIWFFETGWVYSITWIAPCGQVASHARQTMQSATLTGTDLPSFIS